MCLVLWQFKGWFIQTSGMINKVCNGVKRKKALIETGIQMFLNPSFFLGRVGKNKEIRIRTNELKLLRI
jgi:hypothetical protein